MLQCSYQLVGDDDNDHDDGYDVIIDSAPIS